MNFSKFIITSCLALVSVSFSVSFVLAADPSNTLGGASSGAPSQTLGGAGSGAPSQTLGGAVDPTASAQNQNTPTPVFQLQNPLKVSSLGALVKNFLEILSYVAVIIGVLVLIYIGFRYIVEAAQGNADEIKKLHSWLLWAVVGIGIVIASRVIVDIVINTISATGTVSPNVIQSARNANQ